MSKHGVAPPNYTQIPNAVLHDMPDMKEAELRLILAVCRQTFGFHKRDDVLSLSQLQALTGMSRQGVVNALEQPHAKKYITRTRRGGSYSYRLEVVNEVDHPLTQVVNDVDQGSQRRRPEVVNDVDTQKKRQKKTSKRKRVRAREATGDGQSEFGGPSLSRCIDVGRTLMLDEKECRRFWAHYESRAWEVRGSPIRSVKAAMMKWKQNMHRFKDRTNGKHKTEKRSVQEQFEATERLKEQLYGT